ncbi:MAG: 5'-nucleotidase C-terminal domain-containing protein [Lachnospiraceae bacterium]|nr:5'-nucleotidase C-terminal domain-containing protein [Lachnospiraceae bacterium]
MKQWKKIQTLLLSMLMILSLTQAAFADQSLAAADEDIVVLYTNDVHTHIDNEGLRYSNIAAMKKEVASAGADVLLVDAGDHIQGTAYGSMDKGATIVELMNASGYDLATLGNHEFDYGMEGALNVIQWAGFPYVSANFYHEVGGIAGDSVLDAYKVFDFGDTEVAFIGITTPESFTKSTPAYFQDASGNYIYGIAGGADGTALYSSVQKAIDAASNEADVVIALGHLGDDPASRPWTSEELIANTTGLDAFIDGHSHSTVEGKAVKDKSGNEVWLTQTGEYLDAVGKMTIKADGTIMTELVTEYAAADESVKAIEDGWINEINSKLGQVSGSISDTLDNYDADGNRLVRSQETHTGDFAADALYYLFDNMDMDVDFAIMNGGGIRNKAVTGELSYLTCKEIHTFGNVACLQTVTGQQMLDALEWGAKDAGGAENGGFLQVSGLKYTIDTNIPSTVQKDEKGVWIGGPTGEYRVKDVQVLNNQTGTYEALDLNANYNLAGYNYTLRDLGDGFAMFDGAVNVLDYVMEDYMVLANYIQSFGGSVVTGYSEPQGRITVIASEVVDDGKITVGGLDNNLWTTKYGNLYCDLKVEKFFAMGYGLGDLVKVKFLNQELVLPVVPTYSYVDSGEPAIIAGLTDTGAPTGYLSFAINMGNFTETYGIAAKKTDEAGNWWFEAGSGVTFPMEITFEMAEEEGYMAEYILHELSRTNAREDYAALTDEQFANFRKIAISGMGNGILYRSSSPINPEIGRNMYADAAIKEAGVKTIVNLADSKEEAYSYPGFADSYYSAQNVIYLGLGVDFQADDFKAGLAEGLRFMAANEGPYLVHCTEGKDRAGFVSALLSCFMGAGYEEVIADYMTTYDNYYGVKPGTDKYNAIAESNIIKSLKLAFGVEDLAGANLAAEAEEYIASIGLNAEEIASLKENLSVNHEAEPENSAANATGTVPASAVTSGYVVVRGDSLWLIAKNHLGAGRRWTEIYEMNKGILVRPDLIFAGQVLAIPAN